MEQLRWQRTWEERFETTSTWTPRQERREVEEGLERSDTRSRKARYRLAKKLRNASGREDEAPATLMNEMGNAAEFVFPRKHESSDGVGPRVQSHMNGKNTRITAGLINCVHAA